MQGSSAGAHLACTLATGFRTPKERPAFQIMFYGAITPAMEGCKKNGTNSKLAFQDNKLEVVANTPPAFIMVSADDRLCVDLCVNYFLELKKLVFGQPYMFILKEDTAGDLRMLLSISLCGLWN